MIRRFLYQSQLSPCFTSTNIIPIILLFLSFTAGCAAGARGVKSPVSSSTEPSVPNSPSPTITPSIEATAKPSPSPPTPTESPSPTVTPPILPVAPGTPVPTPPAPITANSIVCAYTRWEWSEDDYSKDLSKERSQFGSVVFFYPAAGEHSLAIGSNNGSIALFNLSTGSFNLWHEVTPDRITGLVAAPVSSHLFVSSNHPEIHKWKLQGPASARDEIETLVESLQDTLVRPQAMIFSDPNLLIGTREGTILALEAGKLAVQQDIPNAHASYIWDLDTYQGGGYLLSGGADNAAFLWKMSSGLVDPPSAELKIIPPSGNGIVSSVALTTYNEALLFALGTENGFLTLHTMESLVRSRDQILFLGSGIWSIDFSPDGKLISVGTQSGDTFLIQTDEIIEFYDGAPKPSPTPIPITISPEATSAFTRISSVEFSPDGLFLAVGHPQGAIIIGACP